MDERETNVSVEGPEESGPPLQAKFNDAIKIWRSLDKANPVEDSQFFLLFSSF